MKTILKIAVVISAIALTVPEANALFGVRRRTMWFTAAAVSTADAARIAQSQQQAAAAQQQAAAAQQQAATANAEAAAAKQQAAAAAAPAPPPAAAGAPLPIGTVVSALPPGCVSTPVGGVEYYYGGGNFYRAVFQGNNLVYVTAQPQ
jgi:predicted lipid-binding transport protein (Tim44 family)